MIDSRKVPYADKGFIMQKDQKLTIKSVSAGYNNPTKQVWQPQTAQNATLACINQSAPIVTDFCLDGDEAQSKSKSGLGCQRKVIVRRYDRVERLPYKVSPIIADVYINRQLWRSYRIYEKDVELEFGK